jgi:hypothetical protein
MEGSAARAASSENRLMNSPPGVLWGRVLQSEFLRRRNADPAFCFFHPAAVACTNRSSNPDRSTVLPLLTGEGRGEAERRSQLHRSGQG